MLDGTYGLIQNAFALNALLKNPLHPDTALGVETDEKQESIPILIFNNQHLPPAVPQMDLTRMSYEQTAIKGSGDTLNMEDFSTKSFDIGSPYGGAY